MCPLFLVRNGSKKCTVHVRTVLERSRQDDVRFASPPSLTSKNSFLRNDDVVGRSSHSYSFVYKFELFGEENNATIADVACVMVSSRRETGSL